MKVKKSDFGYNLDNIKDAEQKSFMDNILGAMCDVVNKANDGLITKEDIGESNQGRTLTAVVVEREQLESRIFGSP